MRRILLLVLLALPFGAGAIVIRDDVADAKYRVAASEFPALVDLPGEGHGVLIALQWVVTAAHAVMWQTEIKQVTLNGTPREVERLVVHPGTENRRRRCLTRRWRPGTGPCSAWCSPPPMTSH